MWFGETRSSGADRVCQEISDNAPIGALQLEGGWLGIAGTARARDFWMIIVKVILIFCIRSSVTFESH
jgi:hypothetical protein